MRAFVRNATDVNNHCSNMIGCSVIMTTEAQSPQNRPQLIAHFEDFKYEQRYNA